MPEQLNDFEMVSDLDLITSFRTHEKLTSRRCDEAWAIFVAGIILDLQVTRLSGERAPCRDA